MSNLPKRVALTMLLCLLLLGHLGGALHAQDQLEECAKIAYSTEEDFITQGPVPADGNPIISDGDLLSNTGVVCARNQQLLNVWEVSNDLGLDAADVIHIDERLIAFSTELDDPQGRFSAGDLLTTAGAVIPNEALLTQFQVGYDLGLDAVHFVGELDNILTFLEIARERDPSFWLDGADLPSWLRRFEIDIWFSTEGTQLVAAATPIYDGDLLSVVLGVVVLSQDQLMLASVPAGIPNRGVDFGLDAATGARPIDRSSMRFSPEILYRGTDSFTDGDVLHVNNGVEIEHTDLVAVWEPHARFLGIDALYMAIESDQDSGPLSSEESDPPVGENTEPSDPPVDENADENTELFLPYANK